MPLCAQYAGPAILSRGDAPTAMEAPKISFRPFIEVNGVYTTGLTGVGLNDQGQLANVSAEGVELTWGVSGSHSWRHTEVGLDYHGDITHYNKATYYDHTDQFFLLGLKHQFSRHVVLNWRNTAGMFTQNNGVLCLPQTVPFDPSQSFIPTTDFFDNRTIYGSSMVDLIFQKTSRLSFDLGGGGFINRRRSTALYGVAGGLARADMQYRLTRRSTVGADYTYTHFGFNHIFSSTDLHGFSGTYAIQLSRFLEFTGYGGVMRVETKFVQNVPVDPAVAAIIGIQEGTQVIYSVRTIPNINARLSRTFSRGVAYIAGGHTVTPGNGLFLTTAMTEGTAGYTYTGLRHWSFNSQLAYTNGNSIGNVYGRYTGFTGTVSASRQISRAVHAIVSFDGRNYGSHDFSLYNRTIWDVRVGIGFAPGDVPIRLW